VASPSCRAVLEDDFEPGLVAPSWPSSSPAGLAWGRDDFAHIDSVFMRTLGNLYLLFEAGGELGP
jgi:hypothetical protein